ncbi:MAG: metallophosphoesterase family protein [Planctomycetota bacterium]
MSRLLAIGDIHGCLTALETLAAFVPFADDDVLVTLGDYVDRGPDTREVLDWLIARLAAGRLIPLRGNHEIMLLEARESKSELRFWLKFGGREALASYSDSPDVSLADIPAAHWRFIEHETLPYHETDTHVFVHASLVPDLPLTDQPDDVLFWERFDNPSPHQSGKTMICGHTSQKSGYPLDIGHAVCIDTWVYGEGWLTCLDPATGEYWQANQRGETRRERLEVVSKPRK